MSVGPVSSVHVTPLRLFPDTRVLFQDTDPVAGDDSPICSAEASRTVIFSVEGFIKKLRKKGSIEILPGESLMLKAVPTEVLHKAIEKPHLAMGILAYLIGERLDIKVYNSRLEHTADLVTGNWVLKVPSDATPAFIEATLKPYVTTVDEVVQFMRLRGSSFFVEPSRAITFCDLRKADLAVYGAMEAFGELQERIESLFRDHSTLLQEKAYQLVFGALGDDKRVFPTYDIEKGTFTLRPSLGCQIVFSLELMEEIETGLNMITARVG